METFVSAVDHKWRSISRIMQLFLPKGLFFPSRATGLRSGGLQVCAGRKLTGDLWLKVMHSAGCAAVPSVCIDDGPSSTSVKD